MIAKGYYVDRVAWIIVFLIYFFWFTNQARILYLYPKSFAQQQYILKRRLAAAGLCAAFLCTIRQADRNGFFGIYPRAFPVFCCNIASIFLFSVGYYYTYSVAQLQYLFIRSAPPKWLAKVFFAAATSFAVVLMVFTICSAVSPMAIWGALMYLTFAVSFLITIALLFAAFVPVIHLLRTHTAKNSRHRKAIDSTIRTLIIAVTVMTLALLVASIAQIDFALPNLKWTTVKQQAMPDKYSVGVGVFDFVMAAVLGLVAFIGYVGVIKAVVPAPPQDNGEFSQSKKTVGSMRASVRTGDKSGKMALEAARPQALIHSEDHMSSSLTGAAIPSGPAPSYTTHSLPERTSEDK